MTQKEKMGRHIFTFNGFILNEDLGSKYDSILDIYNRRKDKMTSSEIDFFKSGGKQGENFMWNLPEDISSVVEETIDYLDANRVNWSIEETWAPSFGMLRYLSIDKTPSVLSHIKNLFRGLKNESLIPFIKEDTGDNKFEVWLIDPRDYKDIVGLGPITEWMCFGPDCWIISDLLRYHGEKVNSLVNEILKSDSLKSKNLLIQFLCDLSSDINPYDKSLKVKVKETIGKIKLGNDYQLGVDSIDSLVSDLNIEVPKP